MKFAFFDTETTDKWDFKASAHAVHQPRMVQLGLIVTDQNFKVQAELNVLVKVIGDIPAETTRIHGITNEATEKFGLPCQYVLAAMKHMTSGDDTLFIAHNMDFDRRIIERECITLGLEDFLFRRQQFCTMKSTTSLCGLRGSHGPKWPKLQELHEHFFGHQFDGAHDAMEDIRATLRCFKEIKTRHPELLRV